MEGAVRMVKWGAFGSMFSDLAAGGMMFESTLGGLAAG